MDTSPQNVYAKCLPSHRGYPLWCPEPPSNLPSSYLQDGFQIGDVGFVDHEGRFIVLLNTTYDRYHALHQRKGGAAFGFDPTELYLDHEVIVQSNADPPGCVITSPGIRQHTRASQRTGHYEFTPSSDKGAILILHDGSTSHSLPSNERFRELAVKHALDWYKNAKEGYGDSISNKSLYLITGFRKARSWSLASFHDTISAGPRQITLVPREGGGTVTGRDWRCTFPVEYRDGPGAGQNTANQTIFISGFKIAIRDDVFRWFTTEPEVHPLPAFGPRKRHCRLVKFLMRLFGKNGGSNHYQKVYGSTEINHVPTLSPPPFHPSDLINEYLLSKDQDALVAVTHDSEWMALIEPGDITLEHLMRKDRLEELLSAKGYSLVSRPEDRNQSNNGTALVQASIQQKSQSEVPWNARPPIDNRIVITRIRAEDVTVGLSRMPIGFYVLIQFDDKKRKTENKPIRLNDDMLEWDTCIQLPSEPSVKVQLSVCGSFEFRPMLGDGENLCKMEIHVGDLLRGGHLITFSPTKGKPVFLCSSVFITAEQRRFRHAAASTDDDNFEWETSSELAQPTDQGHNSLLRYHDDSRKENIMAAIEYFQSAINRCPPGHQCRSAALCNLAFAHFSNSRVDTTGSNLSRAIGYYRESLELRVPGHPDRPVTLLRLAQALLYHSEKEDIRVFDPGEITELIMEVQNICTANSHERRAADLVLQTCNVYNAVSSDCSANASELVPTLRRAAQDTPHNCFDRVWKVTNLGLALLPRYRLFGDPNDLTESIMMYKEALQLSPHVLDSPFHILPLRAWANLKLTIGSWKDTLVVATSFMIPRFVIYRVICDCLEATNRVEDALACFDQLCSEPTPNIDGERAGWNDEFKPRCYMKLGALADASVNAGQFDEAISQCTLALSLDSSAPQELLVKRSKAYAGKGKWEDALKDANEVIKLDPSSLLGYQRKHVALYGAGSYADAEDAFQTMLLKASESSVRVMNVHPVTDPSNPAAHSDATPPLPTKWWGPADATMKFECLWTKDGTQCSALIPCDQQSTTSHLRDHGEFTLGGESIPCAWAGCTAYMQRRSIVRHILERHLEVRTPCPFCYKSFTREHTRRQHLERCPKVSSLSRRLIMEFVHQQISLRQLELFGVAEDLAQQADGRDGGGRSHG